MEVPEFDIFKRLETLEKKTLGVSPSDAAIIALVALELAFSIICQDQPESAREFKDSLIAKLQDGKLSKYLLNLISEDLTDWIDSNYPEK